MTVFRTPSGDMPMAAFAEHARKMYRPTAVITPAPVNSAVLAGG